MKQKPLLYFFLFTTLGLLLSSCGSSNKFASSFGKRKYMKGYYVDLPSAHRKPAHASNLLAADDKPIVSVAATSLENKILKTAPVGQHIISRNNDFSFQKRSIKIQSLTKPVIIQPAVKSDVLSTLLSPNETTYASAKSDVNYWAILGCLLSIGGIVVIVIAGMLTIAGVAILAVAAGICTYSLFIDRYGLRWMGALGIIFIILLLALFAL